LIKQVYILIVVLLVAGAGINAQQNLMNRIPRPGSSGGGGTKDSLKHRTGLEDSITINFRYLDSSRYQKFDSSINDFSRKFLIPANYLYLGNTGSATKSLLFSPLLKARSNERFGGRLKDKGCWTTHEVQQVRLQLLVP